MLIGPRKAEAEVTIRAARVAAEVAGVTVAHLQVGWGIAEVVTAATP